jgi:hypothetical protein
MRYRVQAGQLLTTNDSATFEILAVELRSNNRQTWIPWLRVRVHPPASSQEGQWIWEGRAKDLVTSPDIVEKSLRWAAK